MSSSKHQAILKTLIGSLAIAGSLIASQAQAAATIIINNINAAGVGFNDPTPVAPIGGNTGTTLGQQRLNAFTYAANLWGATLNSSVPILINAQFTPLTCTATSATLGSAGATSVFRDNPAFAKAGTWYSYALANKIAGADLGGGAAQINARFNSNLGLTGCLTGSFFYLGLDGNHGSNIDFVAVLQHEMGHGLGFQTFTSGTTGTQLGATTTPPAPGFPAIWDHFLLGTATGKLWKDMTPAERVASAISVDKLVWNGSMVNSTAPSVLRVGEAGVNISGSGAGSLAGLRAAGEASFGPSLSTPRSGQVMPVLPTSAADTSAIGLSLGCDPITGNNAKAIAGNIALLSRGVCGFTIKAKNAQNAGAIGVLVADNAAGAPAGLGGTDPSITIPAVRITQADGSALLSKLTTRSRTGSTVIATLGLFGSKMAGADALGRVLMFAPNPFQSGSSVSHFDTTATRNQLMEPAINGDLTQFVIPPYDLTYILLQETGW